MKVDLFNLKNEKVGSIEISDKVFNEKWRPVLVKQVLEAQLSNRRKPWAHAKTRAEVRGGGRKPWRQKGTGRARHGSIR
ncbi:MAG: 50S ribosomal protein L4, partial [Patescibacteria group bacterium]|nr:50S ribosomal protein L4 [Patescibacteria group bacterium]